MQIISIRYSALLDQDHFLIAVECFCLQPIVVDTTTHRDTLRVFSIPYSGVVPCSQVLAYYPPDLPSI